MRLTTRVNYHNLNQMNALKQLILRKNFTNDYVAEILGVSRHVVQNYLCGRSPMPDDVLEKVQYAEPRDTRKVTRGELVDLLKRIKVTPDQAAAALSKHHDRMHRWASPLGPREQRVPLTSMDLKRIEQAQL
jgi:hypothetical protein